MGDTIRVRTLSGSVWGDTARLIPEQTIGTTDGPDEYVIGYPEVLEVTDDGTILLLDTQVPALRVYAPDGTYVRTIGRKGNGPGEYASPDGIGLLNDGRILVRDPPNGRIALFSLEGEYLGQWHLAGGFNSGDRQVTDTEGNSYVTTILDRGVNPWEWRFGLIRYSPDGEIVDSVAVPTWDFDFPVVTASGENSRSVRPVPFSPKVSWTFGRSGTMVAGLSTDYRIDLQRPSGSVLRIEKTWTPVNVLPDEARERQQRLTDQFRRQYGNWGWNGPNVPGTKPPFTGLFTSREGNVWVVVSTPGVATMTEAEARQEAARTGLTPLRFTEPVAFDVFDSGGRYLGPVAVPPSFRTEPQPIFREDHVWAIIRDELDVPRIVRFRLETG